MYCVTGYPANPINYSSASVVVSLQPTDQLLFLRGNVLYKTPVSAVSKYIIPTPLTLVSAIPQGMIPISGISYTPMTGIVQTYSTANSKNLNTIINWKITNNLRARALLGAINDNQGTINLPILMSSTQAVQYLRITISNHSDVGTIIVDNIQLTDVNNYKYTIPLFEVLEGDTYNKIYYVDNINITQFTADVIVSPYAIPYISVNAQFY